MRSLAVILPVFLILPFALPAEETVEDPSTKKTFPKQITITDSGKSYNLQATGVATRTKFFVKVYSVAHYLQDPPSSTDKEAIFADIFKDDKAKQLTLKWVHDADAAKMKEGYLDSFSKTLSDDQMTKLKPQIDQFIGFFSQDAKVGDEQIIRWLPGGVIEVVINGTSKGRITNPDFAKALWSIWLGPKSVVGRNKLISFIVPSSKE